MSTDPRWPQPASPWLALLLSTCCTWSRPGSPLPPEKAPNTTQPGQAPMSSILSIPPPSTRFSPPGMPRAKKSSDKTDLLGALGKHRYVKGGWAGENKCNLDTDLSAQTPEPQSWGAPCCAHLRLVDSVEMRNSEAAEHPANAHKQPTQRCVAQMFL